MQNKAIFRRSFALHNKNSLNWVEIESWLVITSGFALFYGHPEHLSWDFTLHWTLCDPFFSPCFFCRSRLNPFKRTPFSYERDGTRFGSTHRSKVRRTLHYCSQLQAVNQKLLLWVSMAYYSDASGPYAVVKSQDVTRMSRIFMGCSGLWFWMRKRNSMHWIAFASKFWEGLIWAWVFFFTYFWRLQFFLFVTFRGPSSWF